MHVSVHRVALFRFTKKKHMFWGGVYQYGVFLEQPASEGHKEPVHSSTVYHFSHHAHAAESECFGPLLKAEEALRLQ